MKENELDLLHRYLDGAITPKEVESLEDLLRNHPEARATLRSLATIDAKWQELAANEFYGAPVETQIASEGLQEAVRVDRQPSLTLWVISAIAIAASLIVGALGWFRAPSESRTETTRGIARVIRIDGECKAAEDRIVLDGSELFSGEDLAMQQGLIELAFRETGVHVIATAPLKLKIDSDQRVSLYEGQIKLVVPPQGVGFVVDTAQRKFVDLGTSFVVTASQAGSEVLVLDGQISVDDHDGTSEGLMREGEFARYSRNGKLKKRSVSHRSLTLPELSLKTNNPTERSLRGMVLGYGQSATITKENLSDDLIGDDLFPLIRSGFRDRACLEKFKQSDSTGFRGIAGAFHEFPVRTGLTPYARKGGWMVWHHGQVVPPQPGRYRFWGYADNHLLVGINGKLVFEGSRYDSSFRRLGVARTNNPAFPCLIAPAGFACSDWIELSGDSVGIDLLFGDVGGNLTSGLLLVEREGAEYEETFWGQPKWPLFLTETPDQDEIAEFERLIRHLEEKTMGSFSLAEDAVWKVEQ